jgi:pteridine reductase
MSEATKAQLLSRIPLRRRGEPEDIASTVLFLLQDARYITGQIIAVDGGRSLSL